MKITNTHEYLMTPGGTRSFEDARRFDAWGREVAVPNAWTEPSPRRDWFVTDDAGVAMGAWSDPVLHWAVQRLERCAYRRSDGVGALSPGMRERVVATGDPRSRVAVIATSCNVHAFAAPKIGADFRAKRPWLGQPPLALYAGPLVRANGVHDLADVAAMLLEISPDIRFLIIRDGFDQDTFRAKTHAVDAVEPQRYVSFRGDDAMAMAPRPTLTPPLFAAVPVAARRRIHSVGGTRAVA